MHRTPQSIAFRFVLMMGIVSLCADFAYEGARSIVGPYMAQLGASGTVVGTVAGLGELLGYALRYVSGRAAERTGRFWPITLLGYFVQMTAVPLLALAGSWRIAALLILAERIGKATRTPPRNAMLSHAGEHIGYGWVFGLHQALDQFGATIGPLAVAAVLAGEHRYATAFAVLLIPALMTLALVCAARLLYPHPQDLQISTSVPSAAGLSRRFWIYAAGAAFVAAGVPDFSLISYHLSKADVASTAWIPIFYSLAMGASAFGSLVFGRLFDRLGIAILMPLTLVTALSAPLAFLGGFWAALTGTMLWGLGMGVHESIVSAAVSTMVPVERRASAYGIFSAIYGVAWFLGSALIGVLYDISLPALVTFSLATEVIAAGIFLTLKVVRTPAAESRATPRR